MAVRAARVRPGGCAGLCSDSAAARPGRLRPPRGAPSLRPRRCGPGCALPAGRAHRAPHAVTPALVPTTSPAPRARALLDSWAARYGVHPRLVRAVAWMESGFQTDLTSSVGAWGVMQITPGTWSYVETSLI